MKIPVRSTPLLGAALLVGLPVSLTFSVAEEGGAAPHEQASRPPNVIIVLVDDLGWSDLGCQGSAYYETPSADRLAREGLRFSEGYAAAAICSPTRAALMTGKNPARLGLTDWIRARFQGGEMPADGRNPSGTRLPAKEGQLCTPQNPLWLELSERTLAECLQEAGYATCHIGKWHLGLEPQSPEHQGFDENHGGCDYGQPPSYFDPFSNKRLAGIPTLPPREEGQYLADREGDEALDFIRRHAGEPFFLHLAHYEVHTPIQGRADYVEHFREKGSSTGQKNATYAAMVRSVDDQLGRVLDVLDELELADDTLIVFTSDNGGLQGPTDNAPLRSGKGHPYEGGLRVPWIVRWPGKIEAGRTSAVPVVTSDLLPTVLELCGVPLPETELDGTSLAALFTKSAAELDERPLVWHYPHYRGGVGGPYSVLRLGNWKLIRFWEGPRHELYDLAADLGETHDLAVAEGPRVAALSQVLDAELARLAARLPSALPVANER